jgi:hypothetical protein
MDQSSDNAYEASDGENAEDVVRKLLNKTQNETSKSKKSKNSLDSPNRSDRNILPRSVLDRGSNSAPSTPPSTPRGLQSQPAVSELAPSTPSTREKKQIVKICNGCEAVNSSVFCSSCNACYCAGCDQKVHKLKNRASHNRVPAAEGRVRRVDTCSEHSSQILDFFCTQCDATICMYCRDYGKHRGHLVVVFAEVAESKRNIIREKVAVISKSMKEAETALAATQVQLGTLTTGDEHFLSTADSAICNIESVFDQLASMIGDRRDQLLRQIDREGERKAEQLDRQLVELRKIVNASNAIKQAVDAALVSESAEDADTFAARSAEIESLLCRPVLRFVEPVENSEIPYLFEPELEQAINNFGIVSGPMNVRFTVDETGVCTIRWDAPPEPRVGTREDNIVHSYDMMLAITAPVKYDGDTPRQTLVDIGNMAAAASVPLETTIQVRDYKSCLMGVRIRAVYPNKVSAWSESPTSTQLPPRFALKKLDMQTHFSGGLFHYIGTLGNNTTYQNPSLREEVTVSWSSVGDGQLHNFVSMYNPNSYSYTLNEPNSWMAVDIGPGRSFLPTGYCLRHDLQGPRSVLRNWVLQGRNERASSGMFSPEGIREEWVTLSEHINDSSLEGTAGSTAYFQLTRVPDDSYRFFRILLTGKNSSGKLRLSCAGFELYGVYC